MHLKSGGTVGRVQVLLRLSPEKRLKMPVSWFGNEGMSGKLEIAVVYSQRQTRG